MFPKIVVPQIINSNRVFPYKPSILGYPYFWKYPFVFKVWFWINFGIFPGTSQNSSSQAMCKGGQSREALPSSDAAVMAANCFLLCKFWHHPIAPFLATLLFFLACFGRIFGRISKKWVTSGKELENVESSQKVQFNRQLHVNLEAENLGLI